jgi:hypothetical protein
MKLTAEARLWLSIRKDWNVHKSVPGFRAYKLKYDFTILMGGSFLDQGSAKSGA